MKHFCITYFFCIKKNIAVNMCTKSMERGKTMEIYPTNNQKLVDFFNETIIIISENRKIKVINDSACELLGYSQDELIGFPIEEIISKEEFINKIDENSNIKKYLLL